MDLILFAVLLLLALILIGLGLLVNEHTELAIVGFIFLFLLSFPLINESIVYKAGTDINSSIDANNVTIELRRDYYEPITADSQTSHYFGYYLALAAAIGLIGSFIGLRHSKEFK